MKVLLFYICILLLFISCNMNSTIKNELEEVAEIQPSFEHFRFDTVGYKKYQSFDEFKMEGVGNVVADPYVLVKSIDDTIVVKSSSATDSMRVYYKLDDGVWYSYMEYDMWKKDDYMPTKCLWDKLARTYKRYFYNDTILEIKTTILNNKKSTSAIVKTYDKVLYINPYEAKHSGRVLLSDINHRILFERSIIKFEIKRDNGVISYISLDKRNDIRYDYQYNGYGLWGVQPGLDESCLYEGQDIRNFDDKHPNGKILSNDTFVYKLADKMPVYEEGTSALIKATHIKVGPSSGKKKMRVVVGVVVEKDGCLSSYSIKKSVNEEYDFKAMEVVKKLHRFTPAVLNGEVVRCEFLIPVTFEL